MLENTILGSKEGQVGYPYNNRKIDSSNFRRNALRSNRSTVDKNLCGFSVQARESGLINYIHGEEISPPAGLPLPIPPVPHISPSKSLVDRGTKLPGFFTQTRGRQDERREKGC